ncbi:MAG: hypothetical protein CEN91_552, partial [Candidatus Berkelbacteria bacterium Licking1014_85]
MFFYIYLIKKPILNVLMLTYDYGFRRTYPQYILLTPPEPLPEKGTT